MQYPLLLVYFSPESCNAKANVPYDTLKIMKDGGCRLLLVGDPAQLPPVGPGAVLLELCQPQPLQALGEAAVELTTTYRNNGAIAAVAASSVRTAEESCNPRHPVVSQSERVLHPRVSSRRRTDASIRRASPSRRSL